MRECAKKYYRKGVDTFDKLKPRIETGVATEDEVETFDQVVKGIRKVWGQQGGKQTGVNKEIKEQIEAFRSFKAKKTAQRIHSKKLDRTIVICSTPKERKDMEALGTVEEPIYTCDEIILLIRNGFEKDDLSRIDQVKEMFHGEIVLA